MAGFYGKLPGKGDFLTRNLPRQFVDVWDDWLQSGMNAAKQVLGDEWLQVYLTSPLWRFVLPPGICGESAWAGVMMPSMDRVGQYTILKMIMQVELAKIIWIFISQPSMTTGHFVKVVQPGCIFWVTGGLPIAHL